MTFGYATGEFEVTAERLGCYRPEEHIDNPKDYADNEDARVYDQRLRGPVDEGLELSVDPETGLKTYIASEGAGCETSAGMIRRLLEKSIELGRKHKEDGDKDAFYEALRLLGTSLHCLEGTILRELCFPRNRLLTILRFLCPFQLYRTGSYGTWRGCIPTCWNSDCD